MKFASISFAAVALVGSLVAAWDVDDRCLRRRELKEPFLFGPHKANTTLFENSLTNKRRSIDGSNVDVKSNTNLRGVNRATPRQLDEIFNFQIKMYWEEGYCWQEEWDERKWCLECEGSSCYDGDHLWLKTCDENENEQRFTYEIVDATIQAVKIKPLDRQDLCWTRVAENEHQLRPCGDNNKDELTGLDKQVLIGFAESGRFELHPNGFADELNPVMFKCMSNHHHPKNGEIVKADYCTTARNDKTSKWTVFNAKGPSQAPPTTPQPPTQPSAGATLNPSLSPTNGITTDNEQTTPSPIAGSTSYSTPSPAESAASAPTSSSGVGAGAGPQVVATSSSYCTPSAPCPQCYGDCDTDDDCQGNLLCYQRDGGQTVPSCSGGENSYSKTDYCIDPNWGEVTQPSIPSNEAVTPPPTLPPSSAAPAPTPSSGASLTPTSPSGVGDGADPKVVAVSGSHCTQDAPCPHCHGDCDTDDECQGNLKCYQRDGGQAVPSCSGGEDEPSITDFCIDTNWGDVYTPALSQSILRDFETPEILRLDVKYCTEANKCGSCEGDCDTNDDCEGDLICYQRDAGENVPGCDGEDPSMTDYCVHPFNV